MFNTIETIRILTKNPKMFKAIDKKGNVIQCNDDNSISYTNGQNIKLNAKNMNMEWEILIVQKELKKDYEKIKEKYEIR